MPANALLYAPALLAVFLTCQTGCAQDDSVGKVAGVAVVELFTSQGCSSCPPADRVLTSINDLATEQGLPIYSLSMHVDYWNSLGWADPYSAKAFSDRQRRYAAAAGERQVYTPQMIVGGVRGFNGSNRSAAQKSIREALNKPPRARVDLNVTPAGDTWRVAYKVTGGAADAELVVCLAADAAANHVTRGENTGRQLSHAGVVRTFLQRSIENSPTGNLELTWPAEQPRGDEQLSPVSIVAFVQNPQTMVIDGASRWTEGS